MPSKNSIQFKFVVCTLFVSAAMQARAAGRDGNYSEDVAPRPARAVLLQATQEALDLPLENRVQALQTQGPQGYRNLVSIMMNDQLPMEARWRAITSIGRIGKSESLPELEKALRHDQWFMRSAALTALTNIDHKAATKWARLLLDDKALVVRAAAVDAIGDLKDPSSAPLLWKKLYSKENFRNSQSLFVRRRIVTALADLETRGHEAKFIKVLSDEDETLHPSAIYALERLTGKKMGLPADPISARRELWKKWWSAQASL